MENITLFIYFGLTLGQIAVIILLIVFHRNEIRELRDRLMARDYHDYSVGKAIQKAKPLTDVQQAEAALGITPDDKAMSDRLPVSWPKGIMPAKITKDHKRKGKYKVRTPGGTKGQGMTLRNAKRQVRLLQAVDHGWKPTK